MEPTAEQLIRDYLNRLSVAARTRLRSDDRRAFLMRTREILERRSAEAGADDAGGVLDALATLGEPVAAVENEYARLAAERKKRVSARSGLWRPRDAAAREPQASAGDADEERDSDAVPDTSPAPGPAPGSRRAPAPHQLPRAAVDVSHLTESKLKGDIEKKVRVNRPLSSRWRPGAPVTQRQPRSYRIPRPRAHGSQPREANGGVSPGPGTGPQQAGSPSPGSRTSAAQPAASQTGAAAGGTSAIGARASVGPESPTLAPPGAGSPTSVLPEEWLSGTRPDAAGAGSATPEPASPGAAGPEGASPGPDEGKAASTARSASPVRASAARVVTSRFPRIQRPELPGVGRGIAAGIMRFTRAHRMETAAIVLMVLCALIYPVFSWVLGFSLWLLGAILAAASRQWSLWEKWAGLLGPVALVIAGTSVGLTLGGHHRGMAPYVHEVLADARYMIPIAALLGAAYLAWRAHRGGSFPVPPWHRAHRI